METRGYGRIETVEKGITSANSDLTLSTLVEVNMAKKSLPKKQTQSKTKRLCLASECEQLEHRRGYCMKHEQRMRRHGVANQSYGYIGVDTEQERFWANVQKTDSCWLWTKSCQQFGYGQFVNTLIQGKIAHRYSYTITFGPIPKGLHVLHKCDNPPCVNPSHLFLGTPADNVRDMIEKGRRVQGIPKYGTESPTAKLTESAVLQIRQDKRNWREIAREWGIHRSSVWRIRTYNAWRWLQDV